MKKEKVIPSPTGKTAVEAISETDIHSYRDRNHVCHARSANTFNYLRNEIVSLALRSQCHILHLLHLLFDLPLGNGGRKLPNPELL